MFLAVLSTFGQILILYSSTIFDHFSFVGITQAHGNKPAELPFQRKSLYGFVRHPMMTGFFISIWFRSKMVESDLIYSVFMSLYIVFAVRYFEEPELIKDIGDQYLTYT